MSDSISPDLGPRRHGERRTYQAGCRCLPCRRAVCVYEAERRARKREGWHGWVDAGPARAHLEALRKDLGTRQAAELAGLSRVLIQQVRSGARARIHAESAARILALQPRQRTPGARIRAGRTWFLIRALVTEGFSQAEIARRLGLKTPALQFHRKRVTARTAARVERLHRFVMAEGPDLEGVA